MVAADTTEFGTNNPRAATSCDKETTVVATRWIGDCAKERLMLMSMESDPKTSIQKLDLYGLCVKRKTVFGVWGNWLSPCNGQQVMMENCHADRGWREKWLQLGGLPEGPMLTLSDEAVAGKFATLHRRRIKAQQC